MVTELPEADVRAVARTILGDAVPLSQWHVEPVAYEPGSPATGALMRVRGQAADGRAWSVFVKLVQHVRHWPRLHLLPAEFRESFAAGFPWRQELAAWEEPFAGRLPARLRLPTLYRTTDLGEDRLLLWMEDIDALGELAWDVDMFTRAATALGGLAALRSTPDALTGSGLPTGSGLRTYVDGRVERWAVPLLADDDVWRHPLVADAVDPRLRADLRRIAARLPAVLDRLDTLPQAIPHGDASPQNLLVPRSAPEQFVAIDVSFQCPLPIGFDLGQLLIGLAHTGHLPAAALPEIHDVLVPAFTVGMKENGLDADPGEVAYGYLGSLVARAGLTSLPFELLDAPPSDELTTLFHQRATLSRFLADLGLSLLDS